MIEPFIRRTISLILGFGIQGLIIVVKIIVVTANYMACLLGFQLLGYETWPLPEDKLLGWLFEVFAPEADLCHLYALGLVLTQALGLLFLFHFAFRLIGLWRDRRWYLANNDPQSAREALSQIWLNLFLLCIVALPLTYIIYWDIYLFRYRGVVSIVGIDNPELVVKNVQNWELLKEQHARLFAMFLTDIGALGYIGTTAMICLLFEVTLGKTKDNWARWWETVSGLFQSEAELPAQSVYANGYPATSAAAGGTAEPLGQIGPDSVATAEPAPAQPQPTSMRPEPQSREPVEAAASPVGPAPVVEPAENTLQPVIGGQPGEMVNLAVALQQQERYYVDPVTLQIWDRRAYEAIFGQQEAA